ncbi:MAG TPA: efflux RND transporter permease subunit, partial [Myxococcaceae bacterium]
LGIMAIFNATLTLPGIAGFVLTLGVAVDANVLINERIREELDHGKTVRQAVEQGYDRVFWTIFDSHVTALLAAVILFATGTGPIRGFATTLIIGLLASLFTSIVVTRILTTYLVQGRNAQTLSI